MADVNREAALNRLRDDTGYRDRVTARLLFRLGEQAGVLDEVLADDAVLSPAPRFGGQPAHRFLGLGYDDILRSGLPEEDAKAAAAYHGVEPPGARERKEAEAAADAPPPPDASPGVPAPEDQGDQGDEQPDRPRKRGGR